MAVPTTTCIGMPLAKFLEQAHAAPFDLINGRRQLFQPQIIAPNDKIIELDRKIEAYLADGVQCHLNRNGVLDRESVLPDFQLSLAKVFE